MKPKASWREEGVFGLGDTGGENTGLVGVLNVVDAVVEVVKEVVKEVTDEVEVLDPDTTFVTVVETVVETIGNIPGGGLGVDLTHPKALIFGGLFDILRLDCAEDMENWKILERGNLDTSN